MSLNKESKTNKTLIVIISILTLVIAGLVIAIIFGGKNKDKKKDSEENVTESITTEKEVSASSSDALDNEVNEEKSEVSSDCFVTVTKSNSWESNDNYSGQLDAKIANQSKNNLKDWSIIINVPDGTILDSFWNCNGELENDVLTIKPVEYNGEISANSSLSDIGFIVTVKSESDFNTISENARLYIDGKEYSSTSTGSAENDSTTEAKEENDAKKEPETGTPLDNHGKLSVKGTDIVDSNGDKYQLKGVSTHGIAWFPDYVSKNTFITFRDDWGANLIRLAMYTDENEGYCNGGDKQYLKNLIDTGVQAATELGMYVIVDWHILSDNNPHTNKDEAKLFFKEMSEKYKDYDNVIYEICNEPNGGTTWNDIKSYAEEIIPIIRENDSDAIIIVGTPNWSQDVDIASQSPIEGYDNIMYAIHFYAATHTDNIRSKVNTALDNGLPVFVSEFSICDASGNGAIDYDQADKWFELIDNKNLSYAGWNISNKDETSSLIRSSCSKTSDWTEDDLSETGKWLRNQIQGK